MSSMEKERRWTEKYRHLLQAFYFAFTNGYARGYTNGMIFTGKSKYLCVPGLNCYSCPGAIGACPIGSLQAILGSNTYRISLYVSGMLALFGVFFGRLVCGFLCPFGLVQDLLYKIPFPIKKKNLPAHNQLKYLRYVILAVFVILLTSLIHDVTGTGIPWFCEWICPSGTLLAGVPLMILNPEFREAIGFQFFWKMGILLVIMLGSVAYYRPFCKYLCPLGAIYGVFNPVSTYRLVIDKEKCVNCGSCQKACLMDIRTNQTPNSPDCIRCLKCVSACPTGAIDSSWNIARSKFESRLLSEEENSPNPEVTKTTLLAILTIIAGLATMVSTFKYNLDGVLVYHFSGLTSGRGVLAYMLVTLFKGIVSFFMIITGYKLFINRNDENAVHRFREQTRMILKFVIIIVIAGIASLFADLSLLSVMFNAILICPFPIIGLPLLASAASSTDKLVQGKGSAVLWWIVFVLLAVVTSYIAYISTVIILAG